MNWQPIETAPKGVEIDVIVGWDQATVWIVCSAWYRDAADIQELRECGNEDADESWIGWWSYRSCVTQEKVEPTHWLCETERPPL